MNDFDLFESAEKLRDELDPVEIDYAHPMDPSGTVRWLRRPGGEVVLQELRRFPARRGVSQLSFVHEEWRDVETVEDAAGAR